MLACTRLGARAARRPRSSPWALVVAAPHLRALTASAPRTLARPPSFTTEPEPDSPPEAQPLHADPRAPLAPLPPTNLPVEDYASPLAHTASFFGQLFRYAVYGSVAIVLSTAAALVAVHLYVEHVQLAPPEVDPAHDDPGEWLAELPGWSGMHTAKRGGTDPRLGVLARAAVRGAYIAQTWGQGVVASPLAQSAPANASPFAVSRMGGEMIGARTDAAATAAAQGRQVGDGGWLMAERYLLYALARAATRGIALENSAAWEAHIERGGVDRAAVELEERLAGVRERIGGRARLEAARDGWERIYYALAASPTSDPARSDEEAWERRETLLATRKLGELSARIADLWREGTDERRIENDRAEGWFLGGLVPVLARAEGQSLKGAALDALVPADTAPTKHASPSSSFFGFWSRSHPPAAPSASATISSTTLSPELQHLVALLPRASTSEPLSRPATQRALLASLVSLETFLARRRDGTAPSATSGAGLAAAQSVQTAALEYARAASPTSTCAVPKPARAPAPAAELDLQPAHVSRALTQAYTATRVAALETHLAECTLARAASLPSSSSSSAGGLFRSPRPAAPSASETQSACALLASARERAERAADSSAALLALLETQGRRTSGKRVERAFGESLRRARRDAEKVRELGRALEGFVQAQGWADKA